MDRWFKVDVDLLDKPKFLRVCEATGLDHIEAAGCLVALWAWAHTHGTHITVALERLEQRIGLRPGFLTGLQCVNWVEPDAEGGHRIRFNGRTMQEIRAMKSQAGRRGNAVRWHSDRGAARNGIAEHSQTETKTETETETETENTHTMPDGMVSPRVGTADTAGHAAPRKRRQRVVDIQWLPEAGFRGLDDATIQRWREAAPACSVDTELARAHAWLNGQPAAKRKRNIRRFLTNWMLRAQERAAASGGTARTSAGFASLPHGCWRDAEGIVRTPSGAPLHSNGDHA